MSALLPVLLLWNRLFRRTNMWDQEQRKGSRCKSAFEQRTSAAILSIKEGTGNGTRIERSRRTKISSMNSSTVMVMPLRSSSSYSF